MDPYPSKAASPTSVLSEHLASRCPFYRWAGPYFNMMRLPPEHAAREPAFLVRAPHRVHSVGSAGLRGAGTAQAPAWRDGWEPPFLRQLAVCYGITRGNSFQHIFMDLAA